MKKKQYEKPDTRAVEIQTEAFIATSGITRSTDGNLVDMEKKNGKPKKNKTMKKNIFAALAFLGLVLAGCSKDEILPTNEPEVTPPAAKITTLTATLPDNATSRTAFDEDETVLKVTWVEGDKITLYDETGAATEFTMMEGSLSSDGKSATFQGELNPTKNYTAVYPANAGKDATAWETVLATQTQDMTAETAHLAQNVILASSLTAGTTALSFSSQVAIMKVIADVPDGFTSLTPTSVNIKGAWGENAYSVALANATATSSIAAYIVAPTVSTADVTLSAQITFDNSNEITYNMPEKNTTIANKLYSVKTSKATTGTINGHGWVDLGLPSGTKWATCNVGATTNEEPGSYFAWGDTSTKEEYTESNCATYKKTIAVLKSDGIIDDNKNLKATYDAATQNWGGTWRMPTYAEIQELKNNCTWKWVYKTGRKVTGPNGNSIILPVTGYYGTNLLLADTFGGYWSSTASDAQNNAGDQYVLAYYLKFTEGMYDYNTYYRKYGCAVRPVTK